MTAAYADPNVFEVTDSDAAILGGYRSDRKGLYIVNHTGGNLFVLFSSPGVNEESVSDTFHTFVLGDLQTYEMLGDSVTSSPIFAICDGGNSGRVIVTELYG